jgi:hypothetical protein
MVSVYIIPLLEKTKSSGVLVWEISICGIMEKEEKLCQETLRL